ncbi:MAG: vanadium-dependent haloperoxidase [Hylemonella sp.]|uniref:vanadium-dependent haloperoxidase n=1 Tax=Hylemonella sp. TaxID=2066020 RepID=UPI0022C010F4|nr:vanadium-dependent haloperoxidase [Hylemonella sp.]MCZ8251723.1 vanadium-dependent haloperoxidase [Hylemonella sp.]
MPKNKHIITSVNKRALIKLIATTGLASLLMHAPRSAHAASKSNALELAHGIIKKAWLIDLPSGLASPISSRTSSAPQHNAPAIQRATHWTKQWLRLVVKYQQNPLRASRCIAHAEVAMHDAWLLAATRGASAETRELSAHRAVSLVLQHLFPNETPGFFEVQYAWLASQLLASNIDQDLVETAGVHVGQAVIERSLRDGAGRTWPVRDRPKDFPGMWQAAHPIYAVNPTEPYAGEWRPWLKPSPQRYQPPTAPRPGSEQHRRETREVLSVVRNLTAKQLEVAERWNLEAGSVTPAGVWMQHAMDLLVRSQIPGDAFEAGIAILAATAVAMEDSFIACWRIKFRDWSERPITAIRRDLDPEFTTPVVTPGFPGYISGHSTLSGATSTVLSHFWPTEAPLLNAMADEAAVSRLWGGIHFRSDNDEGLKVGRAVGAEVVAAL